MTLGLLILLIIYSIWSIISLYTIIVYPKAVLEDSDSINYLLHKNAIPERYKKVIKNNSMDSCTTITNFWIRANIIVIAAIIIFVLIVLFCYSFTIKL